jgi:DNA-binding CsgD family transcriptional regulator
MQGRSADLGALLDLHVPEKNDVSRLILAMRAVAAAEAGRADEARRICNTPDVRFAESPLAEARLAQRFALVAYHSKDYEGAISLAETSAKIFGELGAHRLRATSYSILYIIHHSVTRNITEALAWARGMTESAILADDRSFETVGLVAQYEIAAERFDRESLTRLQLQLRSNAYPPQYRERFSARIADFLPFSWDGDFVAFANGITALRDGLAMTQASQALCHSLLALSAVHAGDDEGARESSRLAIDLANLKDAARIPVYELRYCRLARALAAAACILIGDTVRGQRISMSRTHEADDDLRAIVAVAEGLDFAKAPERVRGYARVVSAVMEARALRGNSLLTKSEIEILTDLAAGYTAAEIAERSMRSVHTVRNHTRAIIAKFQVSGRMAAVAHARRLGIIP